MLINIFLNRRRKHVIHDLQPYICTYGKCQDPDRIYGSRREWVEHEDLHNQFWRCSEHQLGFESHLDYRSHISISHETSTDLDKSIMTSTGNVSFQPSRLCPLCPTEVFENCSPSEAQQHFESHLLRFARLVLTSDESDSGDDTDVDMDSRRPLKRGRKYSLQADFPPSPALLPEAEAEGRPVADGDDDSADSRGSFEDTKHLLEVEPYQHHNSSDPYHGEESQRYREAFRNREPVDTSPLLAKAIVTEDTETLRLSGESSQSEEDAEQLQEEAKGKDEKREGDQNDKEAADTPTINTGPVLRATSTRNHSPEQGKQILPRLGLHGDVAFQTSPEPVRAVSIDRMCVEEIRSDTFHNPSFLPRNAFPEFMDRGRVLVTIQRERCFASYSVEEVQGLVEYSIQNPRVFLTLAVTNLVRKMPILLSAHFTDHDLPVRRVNVGKAFLEVSSVADPYKRPWQCFVASDDEMKGWDWDELDSFLWKQWTFLAVIFEESRFEYELHPNCPLPYVSVSRTAVDGDHHGTLFKVGLHIDHTDTRFNFDRVSPKVG